MPRAFLYVPTGMAFALLLGVTGCGYAFQRSDNAILDRYGVKKVFIAPFNNGTYKPGIENLVYNEVVRQISSVRRVSLVTDSSEADAFVNGTVVNAIYSYSAQGHASKLSGNLYLPNAGQYGDFPIPTEYIATLACSFVLTLAHPRATDPKPLWAGGLTRTERFPGNNQLEALGRTSGLINDSEFDRALADMARSMASDLHESMLSLF